ncbi:porin, partial [Pseudoalteromonas sp. 24-MNA-CIBAN-0067]
MKKLSVAVAVCAVLASSYASAEVRINGFASIVGGKSLEDDRGRYGYDDDISFKNESVFALQLSTDLQEKLSATAQIVARGNNDFDAEFEWAYLTYEFNDEFQLSAGKMRVPFYRYSDFIDVGYA